MGAASTPRLFSLPTKSAVGATEPCYAFRTLPRRYCRFFLPAVFFFVTLVVYLSIRSRYPHHLTVETNVHHTTITTPPVPDQPLQPFPITPQESVLHDEFPDQSHRPWLAAVICAAPDVQRRALIRLTWMRLFRDVPFTPRFVVSNPGEDWTEAIRQENRTNGDMIVLDTIQEDDITANTLKTMEFYKWLLKSGLKYEFVTKLDTDLWLNAPAFWDRYLRPRLAGLDTKSPRATVNRTVVGELYFSDSGYATFAHGSIYTVTWDMVEDLVSLQDKFNVFTGEDSLVGILMAKGERRANFINFRGDEKFDYDDTDAISDSSAFARPDTHPQARRHALGSAAIAVHELKDKKMWNKVARCFSATGIKSPPETVDKPRGKSLQTRLAGFFWSIGLNRRYETMYDTIPQGLLRWQDGSWICSGIWNLGKSPRGWQE